MLPTTPSTYRSLTARAKSLGIRQVLVSPPWRRYWQNLRHRQRVNPSSVRQNIGFIQERLRLARRASQFDVVFRAGADLESYSRAVRALAEELAGG